MDDHKLVMIFILHFKTRERCNFCFYEDMLVKILGFGRKHEKKYFFLYLNGEINLKVFEIFLKKYFEFF